MKPFLTSLLAVGAALVLPAQDAKRTPDAGAHEHAQEAAAQANPVRLTQIMAQNLGLETAEVEKRSMAKTLSALAVVEPEPSKVVAIASRVPGRVTKLTVHDGQRVKAGDLLVEVESRVAADPPPRLEFKAPLEGAVLGVDVVTGGAVDPEKNLLTLVDTSQVDVVAQVHEGQLGAIKIGQAVRIRALAYPDLVFAGKVKSTAANVDRPSGTLRVFVHAENPEGKLLPGMRAQVTFVLEEIDPAVVVPRSAVLGEGGDFFVFRQIMTAPFTYERTPVAVGLRDDRYIEIITGVVPGDRVVTRGNYPLQYVGSKSASVIEDDHGHSHGSSGHKH